MSATPLKQIGLNELTPTIVALSDVGGTTDHAEWIRKPGNANRLVGFIIEQLANEAVAATFSAFIFYVHPPLVELKHRFPAYVNPDYEGTRFDRIECCKDIPKENRQVAFEYVHMGRNATTDEVLAEMDRKGLRPALYEELLCFAEKYPDEQLKYPIVALGSEARVYGLRSVAYLWCDGDGRRLSLGWVGGGWSVHGRFLAVRK